MQSGHGGGHDVPVWEWIARDYALTPARSTLDLEPNYEDHPYNPWPQWDPANGYFRDYDVRKQVYRSVFAGACGVTYGHHSIWQFAGPHYVPENFPDRGWVDALHRPGGSQVRYLRALIESRPFFSRIPDQSLVEGDAGRGGLHLQATRDREGTYAFIYFPLNSARFAAVLSAPGGTTPAPASALSLASLMRPRSATSARRPTAPTGFWFSTTLPPVTRRPVSRRSKNDCAVRICPDCLLNAML
jgi:Protein of unknown function (DUF4038)